MRTSLLGIAALSLGVAVATFLLSYFIQRHKHRARLTRLVLDARSATRERVLSDSLGSKEEGSTAHPLSEISSSGAKQGRQAESAEASGNHYRDTLRSGDLAFALSLPQPSLERQIAESPVATSDYNPTGADSNSPHESASLVRAPDKSGVSVRGYSITTIDSTEGTTLRQTNVFARHPAYRRRVRTWEIGTLVRTPDAGAMEESGGEIGGNRTVMQEMHSEIPEGENERNLERQGTW